MPSFFGHDFWPVMRICLYSNPDPDMLADILTQDLSAGVLGRQPKRASRD